MTITVVGKQLTRWRDHSEEILVKDKFPGKNGLKSVKIFEDEGRVQ